MQAPILIVGAGPAGLCSSILLSRMGFRSLVVERHASTSAHPKATGISTRTMELFRSWGIEPRIRGLEIPVEFSSSVRASASSPELERRSLGYPTSTEAAGFSPTWPGVLAQDVLEPILLEHARSYPGADVRFSTELVDFEQHANGVRATIVDRTTKGIHIQPEKVMDGAEIQRWAQLVREVILAQHVQDDRRLVVDNRAIDAAVVLHVAQAVPEIDRPLA